MKRWKAVVFYRSSISGAVDIEYDIEELHELHEIIERGFDWNTIERIEVTLSRPTNDGMVIEDIFKNMG